MLLSSRSERGEYGTETCRRNVGGTNARLALVRGGGDGTVEILEQRRYLCADHPSLHAIVNDFLGGAYRIISSNAPLPIRLAEIRALGIVDVTAVNDFVAVAYAEQCMNDTDTLLLTPRVAGRVPGPTLVIGPGTGLGAALRVSAGARTLVLPSEPQQMTLAPGNPRELAVLRHWMRPGVAHVGVGQAVSGPGLLNLYRALCELDGVRPRLQSSADVSAVTEADGDIHASEAVTMFCGLFGSVVGDLAMVTGATSVFVAGGVPSKIKPQLLGGGFAARMVDKDVMRHVLEQVPVRLVEDPNLGVIGAAAWFLQRRR
jgi:glucokinase